MPERETEASASRSAPSAQISTTAWRRTGADLRTRWSWAPASGAGADTTDWTVAGILLGAVFASEVVAVGRWGTTVGKLLLGLRVLRFHGGTNPGFGRAAGRAGAYWFIGAIPCGIGPLILLVTTATDHSGWRRGWHDRAAGTVVVEFAQ